MRSGGVIIASLLLLFTAVGVHGQIIGNSLDAGTAELGCIYQWFHRDLEPILQAENEWETASFFIRYGAFRRITLSLEGGIWDFDHADFPGQQFRRYTIGAGVGIRLVEIGSYNVNCSFHFNRLLDIDESEYEFHKRIRNITAGIYVERNVPFMEQFLEMWGGVIYSAVQAETYPWGFSPPVEGESENNFGVEAGAAVLVLDHFKPFAQVTFVEYAQARVGFALRLQ